VVTNRYLRIGRAEFLDAMPVSPAIALPDNRLPRTARLLAVFRLLAAPTFPKRLVFLRITGVIDAQPMWTAVAVTRMRPVTGLQATKLTCHRHGLARPPKDFLLRVLGAFGSGSEVFSHLPRGLG
jgi:hypothetical protein